MGKIGIIIGREYTSRVKKKSFILTTLLVPIFIAAMIAVPALIAYYSNDSKDRNIAVTDKSGIVAPSLENSENITYTVVSEAMAAEIKKDLSSKGKYYAVLEIGELDSLGNAPLAVYADEQININLQQKIENDVNNVLRYNKLKNYDIPDLENVITNVQAESSLKTFQVSDKKEEKETSVFSYMAIGYVSSFIIYMFIFLFGSMVMRGVIEEKNNRIVEVIVSSVKPIQLMIGKIVGIALVAVTQFFIWIAIILVIVGGLSAAMGSKGAEKLAGGALAPNVTQIAQTAGTNAPGNVADLINAAAPAKSEAVQAEGAQDAAAQDAAAQNAVQQAEGAQGAARESEAQQADAQPADAQQPDAQQAAQAGNPMDTILSTIGQMNILGILGTFLIFFVLGYLLYSSMFAAVGACVDNEADTQQLILPVTIPLIIGLMIMLNAFQNPNSTVAVWGSIIPFTSPMVMVARFAYGVPAWQYILSVALLIATFLIMAWISAKIYRIGILSYGKKATWKDIGKWLRFKD